MVTTVVTVDTITTKALDARDDLKILGRRMRSAMERHDPEDLRAVQQLMRLAWRQADTTLSMMELL